MAMNYTERQQLEDKIETKWPNGIRANNKDGKTDRKTCDP